MNTSPLLDARLRLEWAISHIGDLDRSITRYFAPDSYHVVQDGQTKPGFVIHKLVLVKRPPVDWKRLVSHIALDLRIPLDYAMVAAGRKLGAEKAESFGMPIADSKAAFEREVKKRKIEQRCPELARFLHTLKPYRGANDIIFALHELNRADKHRDLVTVGMVTGTAARFSGPFIGEVIVPEPTWNGAENGLTLYEISADSLTDAEVDISLSVSLGNLTGFERQPVSIVLAEMAHAIREVLDRFESQFFAEGR